MVVIYEIKYRCAITNTPGLAQSKTYNPDLAQSPNCFYFGFVTPSSCSAPIFFFFL